ncbi:uncharacterized protein GIQ15_04135 [Arthroderma uncinatum]|uniref:uncharacterized protein n=1 Tax=Arthroderma uncinatum TaxID=74035 RepID=UPI00144A8FB0|nr:uncharacterized protein GIQ15_04135 [Arthroderma uncinatum]KAF3481376.1 hypothetical protein GIQ15_04135 [Arthroderma uncinatum]
MQLNLGITADAAAAHRHEYSASPDAQSGASAFFPSARSILSLGFASLTKQGGTPFSSSESSTPMAQNNTYHSIVPSSSVIFQEPVSTEETAGHVESDSDSPGTSGNISPPSSPSKKQSPRSRTVLRFAHPPPTTRHKRLRIRPRLLLQLQQVSNTTRPISTLDVIPSSLFKARSPRKLPGAFAGRDRACTADLIIVPSDTYEPSYTGDDDKSIRNESSNELREPIATISQLRKEDAKSKSNVEIYLTNGLRWTSEFLPKGGYGFTATDEHGIKLCVRWVVRGRRNRSSSIQGGGRQSPSPDDGKRLTFSIIDPQTRRHPIIGWICRTGIEVLDQESLLSIYANRKPDIPGSPPGEPIPKHSPVEINDKIQRLITITGIWVAFQEGWAGNPHVTYSEPSTNSHNTSPLPSPSAVVSAERSPDAGVGDIQTDDLPDRNNNRQSLKSRIRQKGRRSTAPHPRPSSQKPPTRRSCSDDGVGKESYPSTPIHARSCSMLCTGAQESSPPNHPHRPVAFQDLTDHETSDETNYHDDNESHSLPGPAPGHSNRNSTHTATSPISGSSASRRDLTPTPDQSVTSSAGSKDRRRRWKFGDLLDGVRVKKGVKTANQ